MARPDKAAAVAELVEDFKGADATVVTEYRGLTVQAIKELRRSLGIETKYKVAKNTLIKIAAKEAGVSVDESLLAGPSAIAFVKGRSSNRSEEFEELPERESTSCYQGWNL